MKVLIVALVALTAQAKASYVLTSLVEGAHPRLAAALGQCTSPVPTDVNLSFRLRFTWPRNQIALAQSLVLGDVASDKFFLANPPKGATFTQLASDSFQISGLELDSRTSSMNVTNYSYDADSGCMRYDARIQIDGERGPVVVEAQRQSVLTLEDDEPVGYFAQSGCRLVNPTAPPMDDKAWASLQWVMCNKVLKQSLKAMVQYETCLAARAGKGRSLGTCKRIPFIVLNE